MKLEEIFTAEELAIIDSGEYRPGRAVLDAKLNLAACLERAACAKVCDDAAPEYEEGKNMAVVCAAYIRARKANT